MSPRTWPQALMSRPGQFMVLGGLVAMCASFGSTLAAALFLANAGAEALPVYYMLFAALSVPLSLLFSGTIDRWPRRLTMAGLLAIYVVGAGAAALLPGDGPGRYYALYIVISVCELMMYSVYYVLFGDYFTVTEAKKHGGAMTVSLGMGAICGALLLSGLTELAEPRQALAALPVLVGLAIAHLLWLTRREAPLDEVESGAEEGMIDSLKALPGLSRHYPIVWLMAAAMFFNIAVQCVLEFEAFSLYAQAFPDEAEMTAFMGRMTAVVDVVGICIVFFVTNPLIPRLGVARMNLIPPAINLGTFLVLAAWPGLASGILAHLNYYPLEHSLNVPLFALIYNAVPHRFTGRVRVINDGIVYPLALAASGLLLVALQDSWSLIAMALLGAGLAAAYLAAQWGTGREYLRSLMKMLRGGFVDLDKVGQGFRLPDEYRRDIHAMLQAEEAETVTLGLELAVRSGMELSPGTLERILPLVPEPIALAALTALAAEDPPHAAKVLRRLAASADARLAAWATETLLVRRLGPGRAELETLLDHGDETLRAVAAAGLMGNGRACDVLTAITGEQAALAALRVVNALAAQEPSPMLAGFARHPAAAVRARALSLAALSGGGNSDFLAQWARQSYADHDKAVRAAALGLMAKVAETRELVEVCSAALADPSPDIRRAACAALGHRGGAALDVLARALDNPDTERAFEAMDGLAQAAPLAADAVLFAHLSAHIFPRVERNIALLRQVPGDNPAWHPLDLALRDANARHIQLVLHALGALGYKRVLGLVRTAMKAEDARIRANAVETLSSLAHRRYVLPLLPLFEEDGAAPAAPADAQTLLTQAMAEDDCFLRAAAVLVWRRLFPHTAPAAVEDLPMSRLLFLKSVPLFAEMTLDHLMAVDAVMTREQFLPGEAIVTEGESGHCLYIVFDGEVAVRKRLAEGDKELARLGPGQVFGEMSLFDDERRSATVAALTEAHLLALDSEHFHSLAHQRPEIPLQLCKVLAARLRTAIS